MRGNARLRWGGLMGLGLSAILWAGGGCVPCEPEGPIPAEPDPCFSQSAEVLRVEAIHESIESLNAECRRHGDGDWNKWSQSLQSYRNALQVRIQAVRPNYPDAPSPEGRWVMLETERGSPSLFEVEPAGYLQYLVDPESLDFFRRTLTVAVVSRWLNSQGIALVFVPVPKMTEVYAGRMAQPTPPGGIAAPHVRRLLKELLENDVDVIDLLPLFLSDPDRDARPLYYPDDAHWAPRGQQLAAKAIAARLNRYGFVRAARREPALSRLRELKMSWTPDVFCGAPSLTSAQQARALPGEPQVVPAPELLSGKSLVDQKSPVLFIGDSYNEGLLELVAHELNLSVAGEIRRGRRWG